MAGDAASVEEDRVPLSTLLASLSARTSPTLTLDEIIEHFGRRAFGAALFIFAVPNLLPLPPGSSTVLGLPLLLIAPQLAFGKQDPWIPRAMGRRTVQASFLNAAFSRVAPWLTKVEAVTTRRLVFMFGGLGDLLLGLVCTLLAAVLILPIPLGNMLPAAAVVILALSLIQRDGLLAILGYIVAGLSALVLVLSASVVAAAVARLVMWIELL
jgi:hypothetical protein